MEEQKERLNVPTMPWLSDYFITPSGNIYNSHGDLLPVYIYKGKAQVVLNYTRFSVLALMALHYNIQPGDDEVAYELIPKDGEPMNYSLENVGYRKKVDYKA